MVNKHITLRDWVQHGRIINGCWQFSDWHSENTETPVQVLQKYIQSWFLSFDWADIYTWVEEIFWDAHERNKDLWNLRFHTKHVPDLDDVQKWNISQEKTKKQIMRSCNRMKTNILDNVQFHWWDYTKAWYHISISTLLSLKSEWIINHIWVTNCNVKFLQKLEKEIWFIPMTTQNQYSIVDRRVENFLIPHILEKEIWLYCYGSLMGWLLSDRYLWKERPQEPLENRSLRKYLRVIDDWANWELFQELLQVLSQISDEHSVTISEISIAWVLHQKWVSSAIVWVRNTKHLDSLHRVLNIDLRKSDLYSIDTIYLKWEFLKWDVFDLERDEPRHRDIMKFNLNKDEA